MNGASSARRCAEALNQQRAVGSAGMSWTPCCSFEPRRNLAVATWTWNVGGLSAANALLQALGGNKANGGEAGRTTRGAARASKPTTTAAAKGGGPVLSPGESEAKTKPKAPHNRRRGLTSPSSLDQDDYRLWASRGTSLQLVAVMVEARDTRLTARHPNK